MSPLILVDFLLVLANTVTGLREMTFCLTELLLII